MHISPPSLRRPPEWSAKIDRWTDAAPVEGDHGDVFVTGLQHKLYNYDMASGKLNWQSDVGDMLYESPQRASDETVILNSHAHGADRDLVIGVDTDDGRVKWSFERSTWGAAQITDGTVYVHREEGYTAIEPDSGDIKWTIPVKNHARTDFKLSPTGDLYLCKDDDDDNVYLRHFSKVNPESGKPEWEILADQSDVSFSPDGKLGVRHHKRDGYDVIANQFEVRSPENGEKIWSVDRMGVNYNSHFTDDGRVITKMFKEWGDPYHQVESRDTHTGELQWKIDLPPVMSVATDSDGVHYAKTFKADVETGERYALSFTAISPADGSKKWSFMPTVDEFQGTHFGESAVYVSGRRNIGNSDRYRSSLFALDKETGQTMWEYDFGLDHREVIEDSERGRLYVKVGESKVVCLEQESGKPLWHLESDSQLEVNPKLTSDGRLLVSDLNGLSAALTDTSPLVKSGDSPSNPDKDYGMPVATRGYGADYLMEATREILGQDRPVITTDSDHDGASASWDQVLIRDNNGDGEFTNEDLAILPDRAYLESLDRDNNLILVGEELAHEPLTWWRDMDEDGQIGGDEYFGSAGDEPLIDLERLHETRRFGGKRITHDDGPSGAFFLAGSASEAPGMRIAYDNGEIRTT
jgi:outer membrane protein assembly factor BamB